MLNTIFISHWKITLMVFTSGLIVLAIITALYWVPPMARWVEVPISVEQLAQPSPNQSALPAARGITPQKETADKIIIK